MLGTSLFSAAVLGASVPVSAAAAATPTWVDHLSSLAPTRWKSSSRAPDGSWMYNEWLSTQISTGAAGLTDTLNKNPAGSEYPYSSGEIHTPTDFQYGYFQARLQAATGKGLDTGFFLYGAPTSTTKSDEIDVEIAGNSPRSVLLTYHMGSQSLSVPVNLAFDTSAAPHLYGIDWEPGYVRWYVDGKLVLQQTGAKLPLPKAPQKLFFELSADNIPAWLGAFVWPGHPIAVHVSCISVSPTFTTVPTC